MLVTHRKYIILNFIKNKDFECGNSGHKSIARINIDIEAVK